MNYSELEKLIGSKLVHPQDKQYDEVRKIWNSTIDRKPTAIAVCETEKDVIAAVLFAQKNQLSISVRGGGHHVAGFAVCEDGLMIDLSNIRKVKCCFKIKGTNDICICSRFIRNSK
jgi:FAD/FMN-containing dehydrogenase